MRAPAAGPDKSDDSVSMVTYQTGQDGGTLGRWRLRGPGECKYSLYFWTGFNHLLNDITAGCSVQSLLAGQILKYRFLFIIKT